LTRRTCVLLFELLLVVVLLPKVSCQRVLLVVGVQLHTRRLGLRGQWHQPRDLAAVSIRYLPPRTQKALLDPAPCVPRQRRQPARECFHLASGRGIACGLARVAACRLSRRRRNIQSQAGTPSPAIPQRPPSSHPISHGTSHFSVHLRPKLTNFPREAPRLSPAPLAAEAAPPIVGAKSSHPLRLKTDFRPIF